MSNNYNNSYIKTTKSISCNNYFENLTNTIKNKMIMTLHIILQL